MVAIPFLVVALCSAHQTPTLTIPNAFVEMRLSAEHLVASGVDAESVSGIVANVVASSSLLEEIAAIRTQLETLTATIEELTLQAGDASEHTALNEAIATRCTLEIELQGAVDALANAAVTGQATAVRERLARLRASAASPLPTELRVIELDAETERTLAVALRQEQRHLATGSSMNEELSTALSAARGHSEVTAALLRLQNSLDAMNAALVTAGAAAADD